MAFKAKFTVEGTDFNVLSCSYNLYKETDATGKPSNINRGGIVTVTIESTDDTSLFTWMVQSLDRKGCSLKFFKRDSESAIMKQVDFIDASLISYEETFSSDTGMPMMLIVKLSAEKMTIGGATHTHEWIK